MLKKVDSNQTLLNELLGMLLTDYYIKGIDVR